MNSTVDSGHLLGMVSNTATNTYVQLSLRGPAFSSLVYMPKTGITESCRASLLFLVYLLLRCGFLFLAFFPLHFLKTGFHCVALVVLELPV